MQLISDSEANKIDTNIEKAHNRRLRTAEENIIAYMEQARVPVSRELERMQDYETTQQDGNIGVDKDEYEKGGKKKKAYARITTAILGILLLRDNNLKRTVNDEYNISWYESSWSMINRLGIDISFGNPSKKARKKAFDQIINKLSQPDRLRISRRTFVNRVLNTIEEGLNGGKSVKKIARDIDIVYGFRNRKGQLNRFGRTIARNGEIYNSIRVARTEMGTLQALSQKDHMLRAQKMGIVQLLRKLATLDDRTRQQSAEMDGQISREDGKFRYPDKNYYFMGTQPIQWRVNDRGTTIPLIEDVSEPIARRQRDVLTGKTEITEFKTFNEYAKEKNIKINRFGQKIQTT